MLVESCRAVLAIALDRNDLAPVVFDNLTREHFTGAMALVFDTMQEHAADGMDCSWTTIRDAVGGRVNPALWQALMDSTRGIHPSGAEAYLREKVQAIKADAAQKKLLSSVEAVVRKPKLEDEDIDELEKTTQAMRLVDRPKESASLREAMNAYREHIRQAASDITLGWPSFDRHIDGFNRGELVTVMARAAVGKTWIALNIIDQLAGRVPYKMALFSLEMPKSAIVERLLEVNFGLGRREVKEKMLAGELDGDPFERRFAQLAIYDKIYSVAEIRKIVEREGYRVVFIDFLHLVRPEVEGTPYQQVSQIMAHLKQMAKDTGCVAFLLHQLSRKAGSGWTRVEVDHARDSGQVEELSDFIFGAWAPGLNPDAPAEMGNVLTVGLLKNKRGQRACKDMTFDKVCGRIYEPEEGEYGGTGEPHEKGRRGLRDWSEPGVAAD